MSGNTPFSFRDRIAKARSGISQAASQAEEETAEADPASLHLHQPPGPAPEQFSDPQPPDRPLPHDPIHPIQGHEPPAVDAPEVDSIDARSDMRAFMSPDVCETLRRQALRKWFHLPEFNRRDGLDDYDGDFREFNPLGDMVTAHMKHQMQRTPDRCGEPDTRPPGREASPANRPLPSGDRDAPATPKARNLQASPDRKTWEVGRGPEAIKDNAQAEDSRPATTLLWDAARCAHGSGALPGCTRCRDACAGGAIFFEARGLELRLERCSGQGTCSAVCPTGAIRPVVDEITPMLKAIRALAGQGEEDLSAVFCSPPASAGTLRHLKERLPELIVALHCRLPAGPGPEAWLAALAMGACRVIVFGDPSNPVLQEQVRLAHAVMAGLDLDGHARLLGPGSTANPAWIERSRSLPPMVPAAWPPSEEKRTLLWQAVDHLQAQSPGSSPQAPLPPGAPLGEVRLDTTKCTLCMACVGACPTGALVHGAALPQVRFRERDCIQCGLCRRVCPERAVTLSPRICYDRDLTRAARVLHQAEPLNCSVCGRPFASRQMVDTITRKLSAHWMYLDPAARDRLRMCRDCRIGSLYAAGQQPHEGGGGKGGEK